MLVEQLQKNVTVDWHLKESARAKLRVLVRRILKNTDIHLISHQLRSTRS
ncbi:type I restriction enzyme endonuclease domain-containing protein [Ruegeria faecimaris]|nr:type I restriction enzyme endonuclease domain-containing protein [Ruegeria faecimaris]